ncbi:MAG: RluA family pseudouridine synthase [Clostridiales bacterium]|nr:RluA family pseudouridine synthase [Clostridiales bacterium]
MTEEKKNGLTADGRRLDVMMAEAGISRSQAARLIRLGQVTVDGRTADKPSLRPDAGAEVCWTVPETKETALVPQNLPLEVLYQDAHLAVVVKPAGMVVHPAAGNPDGTLVNALMYHLDHLSGIGGEKRPGIVHRLDKDTSGLMLVAKDDATHAALSRQLADRQMEKHYRAMVLGRMKEPSGRIEAAIGRSHDDRKKMAIDPEGRMAVTEWTVLREWGDKSLLDVHILTGRTHQIRVHMRSLGHPVLGDPLYGFAHMPPAPRLMLHAYSLRFTHPATGENMTFCAPCPFCDE